MWHRNFNNTTTCQSYHVEVIAFLHLYWSNLQKYFLKICDINHLHSNNRLNKMGYYVILKTIKRTFE